MLLVGAEMVEDRTLFDCGDVETAARLAGAMLDKAPDAVRRLFSPA